MSRLLRESYSKQCGPLSGKGEHLGRLARFLYPEDKDQPPIGVYGCELPFCRIRKNLMRRKIAYMEKTFSLKLELHGTLLILRGEEEGVKRAYDFMKSQSV